MAAQYSMPFTAAVALTRDPRDPRHYAVEALQDEVVCDLARRVELYPDAEMEALYPRYGTRAEVKLKDGRTLETKLLDAHGTPEDPCSEDEFRQRRAVHRRQWHADQAEDSRQAIPGERDLVGFFR